MIIPQLNDAIGVRTAERFDVKEAHRIGLLHEIVPLAELQAAGERKGLDYICTRSILTAVDATTPA
jgi:hypothetical protein